MPSRHTERVKVSSLITESDDQKIVKFVEDNYGTKTIKKWDRKRNPHLDHECGTPQYEVNAGCHKDPQCKYETIHTIVYVRPSDNTDWQTTIAQTTCGKLVVWSD